MIRTHEALEAVFRREHGLVVAALARTFGDVDLAEEALADAVASALETWRETGVPRNPAAWLTTVARRRAIDRLRRQRLLGEKLARLAAEYPLSAEPAPMDDGPIPDERLRLIFACCHPALSPEARVALTLRSLGGLTTAEIARGFLTSEPTMFQRISRARGKMRLAGIPIEMPRAEDLPARLEAVLAVVYLVFTEGHSPMAGDDVARVDLCREAIRLSEMVAELMPDEAEATALAALLWLTDARRAARVDANGDLVLLEAQDRSRWDGAAIARGLAHLERARTLGGDGAYRLQAEIAAVHAEARTAEATDWDRIVDLYRRLLERKPSPVVALNLAAAVAMAAGPSEALDLLDPLADALDRYQPFHAARGELLLRAGRAPEARAAFERALAAPLNEVERRHLERRRDTLPVVDRASG